VLDAQGQVYVAADETLSVVRFAPGVALPSTWAAPGNFPEIELAFANGTLWWASNDGANSALWSSTEGAFVSPSANATTLPGSPVSDVVGLVADGTGTYAAVSTPRPVAANAPPPGPSPDSWQWPAATNVDTPADGAIYRVVPGSPFPTLQRLDVTGGITFFPGFMMHVLAQSSTEVYWVDSAPVGPDLARVMAATKADWTTDPGRRIGGIQARPDQPTGFVGLAASDSYVAWAAAPEPYYGTSGCWVWASAKDGAAKEIFDSDTEQTSFSCSGLAIDDTYAYFTMVHVAIPPAGPDSAILLGSGIARVPLAGGALETVPLTSDRWYGARRVLVDDTYVYALDPSYVLRFPKTAFGP
jgi:hypothetical protein